MCCPDIVRFTGNKYRRITVKENFWRSAGNNLEKLHFRTLWCDFFSVELSGPLSQARRFEEKKWLTTVKRDADSIFGGRNIKETI